MVSIVLPTYNGKKYIEKSIKSIIGQTYEDIELIVVDDCSTDGTDVLLDAYAKKDLRIHVIHNEVNKKLPASLNIGFSIARGEYFTWTSDDNYYTLDAIEEMVNYLKEHSDTALVYADFRMVDENDVVIKEVIHEKKTDLYGGNCVGACFLYKRKVHEVLKGYNEKLFLVEDYDFWLRAGLKFKLGVLNKKLYFYRVHEESLTGTRKQEIIKRTDNLLYGIYKEQELSDEERLKILERLSIDSYHYVYNRKNLKKYMCMIKEISKAQYKMMGIEMIIGQYLPKTLVKWLKTAAHWSKNL